MLFSCYDSVLPFLLLLYRANEMVCTLTLENYKFLFFSCEFYEFLLPCVDFISLCYIFNENFMGLGVGRINIFLKN